MKNIAFLVPNLTNGGAQRVAARLSNIISDFAKPVAFVYQREISYSFAGKIVSLDLPYHYEGNQSLWARLRRRRLAVKAVRNAKKEFNISTTISFLTEPNIVNALSTYDDRIILTAHSILSITRMNKTKYSDYIDELLIHFTFRMADQIVAVSKFMGKDLLESYGIEGNNLKVIPNSVDIEVLRKKSEEQLPTDYLSLFDSPVVLNVGRLTHQKGHRFLIRAFKKVARKVEEAKLVILGQGRLRDSIVRLIQHLGLEKKVHLLGFQDNPLRFIRRSEVFVLSSRWEGLPLVVLEALSVGTPVVAADCRSGPREILAPSTSYLYEASSMEAAEYGVLVPPVPLSESPSVSDPPTRPESILANAVTKMLTRDEMRKKYAQRGIERASDFSHRNVRDHWLNIL